MGLALAMASLAGAAWAAPDETRPNDPAVIDGPELPVEGVISNPDWIQTPNGDDFANFYPKLASALGIGGRAVAHCSVSALGLLENCSIVSETPLGMGFGAATLAMMSRFHMRPRTVDGAPVSGGTINIPIRFQPPEIDTPPTDFDDGTTAAQPTARALDLARQLVDAQHLGDLAHDMAEANDTEVRALAADAPASDATQAAVDAFTQAEAAEGQALIDWYVTRYARNFSEAQMAEMVKFFAGPAGQAWIAESHQASRDSQRIGMARSAKVQAEAKRLFCQKIACYAPPPSTPATPQAAAK